MRIVKMKGGLGNQMFQYAFAKLVQQETGEEVKMDFSSFDALGRDRIRTPRILKFRLSLEKATDDEIRKICKFDHTGNPFSKSYKVKLLAEIMCNRRYYFERNRAYREPGKILDHQYFDGYWQSWRYVDQVWPIVQKEFVPNASLHLETEKQIEMIKQQNSVFVGIRRGDYTEESSHYGCFQQEYYDRTMKYMETHVENPVFYIFSNDIEWVKSNMNFEGRRVVYREREDIIDDFDEFLLMSACQYSICVNSSYHWWAARMNDDEKKIVIVPEKWFFDDRPIDIVPEHWIRM